MAYDDNNVFAKILRGEIPCDKVYEDEHVLAFRDIQPQTRVHVLVIPKGAYVSFADFSQQAGEAEITGFFRAAGKIAKDLGVEGATNALILKAYQAGLTRAIPPELRHKLEALKAGKPPGAAKPTTTS